jgi:hypothetical protein
MVTKVTDSKNLTSKSTFLAVVVSEPLPPNSPDLPPQSVPKRSLSQTKSPSPIKLRFPRPAPKPRSKIKDAPSPRDHSSSMVESKLLRRVKTPARASHLLPNAEKTPVKPSNLSPSRATTALKLLSHPPMAKSTTTAHAVPAETKANNAATSADSDS